MLRRPPIQTLLVGLIGLGLLSSGCEDQEAKQYMVTRANPVIPLDSGIVRVMTTRDTFEVSVELAETAEQKSTGLMERRALPEAEGMLFLYAEQQAPDASFYMFRTRIPLDIAYVDSAGGIVALREMEPCTSPSPQWCETYSPGVPYWSALEVQGGFFSRHGVGVGDRIVLVERAGSGKGPNGT